MSIVVDHSVPAGPALAGALGTSQAAARDAQIADDHTKFLLGLRQREREFNVNTAMRLRGQDIEQRQWQTNLAMQDARQQQLAQANVFNKQVELEKAAMREQGDAFAQQQQQAFEWQQKAAMGIDEQVGERIKSMQQLNLNPEGQRIRNEKLGKLRQIQANAGSVRPAVHQQFLGQWLGDLDGANINAYENKEPTAHEKVYNNLVPLQGQQIVPGQPLPPGTYRSLKGTRNGVDSWETITIPKEDAATVAERFQRDSFTAPDGRVFLWNPDKQDWTSVAPVKPEKTEKPVDPGKYVKEAIAQLRADHAVSQADKAPADKTEFNPGKEAIKKKAKEMMDLERELQAEMESGDAVGSASSLLGGLGMGAGVGGALGSAALQGAYAGSPAKIDTQDEYDSLPSGAEYIDAQTGARGRKP